MAPSVTHAVTKWQKSPPFPCWSPARSVGAVGECVGHGVSRPEMEEDGGREQELGFSCHSVVQGGAGGEERWG